MRILISLTTIIVLTILLSGCSSSQDPISQPDIESGNTSFLYSGTFDIDLETLSITQKNRQSDTVYDITGFLPDKCPGGCFRYRIVNVVGTVLEIELTIENPLAIQVYDVRLVYTDLFGKTVLNQDSYTDFPGTPITQISPFTAFAKETADRAFPTGPGGIDTETLLLDFPPGSQSAVNYSITAHLPGQTPEPYEISDMSQTGTLTPTGGNAIIRCDVDDHQDNVSAVYLDARPFTGNIAVLQPDVQNPGYWKVEISNTAGAPEGNYKQLIMARSPNPQNINIYNYVEINVSSAIQWKNIRLRTDSPAKDLAVTPDGDLLILYDDAQVWKYTEANYFAQSSATNLFTAEVVQWSQLTPPPSPVKANAFMEVSDVGNIFASNATGAICEHPVGYWPAQSFDPSGIPLGTGPSHCTGGPIQDVYCYKSGSGGYNLHHVVIAPDSSGAQSNMYREYYGSWGWAQQYGQECYGPGYNQLIGINVVAAESAGVDKFWALEDSPDYYGARFIQDTFFYYHYNNAYFGTGTQTEADECWNEASDLTSDINENLYVLDKMSDGSGRIKGFTADATGGTSLGHFDVPDDVDPTPLRIEGSDVSGNFGNLVFVLHGDFGTNGCYLSVFLPDEIPW